MCLWFCALEHMLPGLMFCICLTKLNTSWWLGMRKNGFRETKFLLVIIMTWTLKNNGFAFYEMIRVCCRNSHKHEVIVYWLSLFLCPKIPQKRLVSASGTLFWPRATTHTNLLQLSCEFRWSRPARPGEAQWKVKEWKRTAPDPTALKNTHLHPYLMFT